MINYIFTLNFNFTDNHYMNDHSQALNTCINIGLLVINSGSPVNEYQVEKFPISFLTIFFFKYDTIVI